MALNNNNECNEPTIAEFYAGKNIFITGATGFLGTVLIEALLSSTPKIGTIYLLVRDKYGSDTKERVRRLLAKPVRILFYLFEFFFMKNLKNFTIFITKRLNDQRKNVKIPPQESASPVKMGKLRGNFHFIFVC